MRDKMSKEDMLGKFKELEDNAAELRAMVEEIEKMPKKLVARVDGFDYRINGKLAMALCSNECNLDKSKGSIASGRGRVAHLYSDHDGTWFTEAGEEIHGNLYYKPSTD